MLIAISVLLDPIRLFFIYIHMAMVPSISNATLVNHNSVSLGCHHRWQVHRSICEKWAVQMGSATKRSFISAYFLLSAYFLTAQSYKRMRLTTRVYGICIFKVGRYHHTYVNSVENLADFKPAVGRHTTKLPNFLFPAKFSSHTVASPLNRKMCLCPCKHCYKLGSSICLPSAAPEWMSLHIHMHVRVMKMKICICCGHP